MLNIVALYLFYDLSCPYFYKTLSSKTISFIETPILLMNVNKCGSEIWLPNANNQKHGDVEILYA